MTQPLKILMLEDSEMDAVLIQQFLLAEKPECLFELVMTAEDFTDALYRFEPQVILSDNSMPRFDAAAALEICNRMELQIPFILVTGTVSEEFAAGIIKMGADDYILKDRLARLPAAIDTALRQRNMEAEKLEAQKKLASSEERYRLLFERNLAGVYQSTVSGKMISCNDAFARMLGYTAAEAVQLSAYRFYFAATAREEIISRLYKEQQLSNQETILRHRDGGEVFAIENMLLHRHDGNGEDVIESVLVDITERKLAEEESRFAADLLKTVGQAVIAIDVNGLVTYWNRAAENIYGWTAAEAMGRHIMELTTAEQSKEQAVEIMNELAKGKPWSGEFLVRRKDGSHFPTWVTDSPVYDQQGRLSGIIGVSVDLTERKQTEENLRLLEKTILEQKIQEQKKISRAIIKAQEDEKTRIGQELHDNINQILVSSKLYLNRAGKQHEGVQELVKYPMELIDMSIHEIRQLSRRQVTPSRSIDLQEMVEQLLAGLDLHQIAKVHFTYDVSNELVSEDLKLNIYRIIQEQLNNILKHARAQSISLQVKTEAGHIHVFITDDGRGFDMNHRHEGIGIANMTNRAESFNGTLEIESIPGHGTSVNVQIPLMGTDAGQLE